MDRGDGGDGVPRRQSTGARASPQSPPGVCARTSPTLPRRAIDRHTGVCGFIPCNIPAPRGVPKHSSRRRGSVAPDPRMPRAKRVTRDLGESPTCVSASHAHRCRRIADTPMHCRRIARRSLTAQPFRTTPRDARERGRSARRSLVAHRRARQNARIASCVVTNRCADASLFRRTRATVGSMHARRRAGSGRGPCERPHRCPRYRGERARWCRRERAALRAIATATHAAGVPRVTDRVHAKASVHAALRSIDMRLARARRACTQRVAAACARASWRLHRACARARADPSYCDEKTRRRNSGTCAEVEINMRVDDAVIAMRARSRPTRFRTQVFLHFFLNIIEQTNYDSP